jgi:isochorismate hydrolase
VRARGRKQLIIAGIVTDVCVAFPALSAINEGYEVFVAVDASGTFNTLAREAAHKRLAAAGVQLWNWFAIACELHRDWRRDIEGLGSLFAQHIPDYANLISSFAAQK